ncbi:MAG: phosphate ABC transporter substrate-binding protein PstS [Cyanophyceae cyanobacterium]
MTRQPDPDRVTLVPTSRRFVVAGLAASVAGLVACQASPQDPSSDQPSPPPSGSPIVLNGAGASFPAILYLRWFSDYLAVNPNIVVNYQSLGSAAGIQQILDGTVDFGASDVAMSDEEINRVSRGVILVPMTAGSIVVSYNLPGIGSGLRLSRAVFADLFLGIITRWNDPRLVALNPDLELPDRDVVLVYRADGSGTTHTFTSHLSAISPSWREQVGMGVSVEWPAGFGALRNEGVSAQIQLEEGVLAYVENAYAVELNLSRAALENQTGSFVLPTPESTLAAVDEIELPDNLRGFNPDPVSPEAYPISTYTWILLYKSYPDPDKARAIQTSMRWCLTEGQRQSTALGYLPLPARVVERGLAALDQIEV